VLVDPLAVDPEPLREILLASEIVKVFHSCGEDLEVLFHRFEIFPRPLFDTQTAAAFAGLGSSLAYGALVAELFDVELPKGETRSNWLRRPLTGKQQRYAALDVAYLLPIYDRLQDTLHSLGRRSWVGQEVEQLADARRFLPDPETVYLSFARWTMSRRELAVLRAVSAWREHQARLRDLPRNFVLPKEALVHLARRCPRSEKDVAAVQGLRPADRERHGRTLLRLVTEALELPSGELPSKLPRPVDLAPHRDRVQRLRRAIAAAAAKLGIPSELLANRKTTENLVRGMVTGAEPVLPSSMTQWRREILAELVAEASPAERQAGERSG
ncbi:MAG: HRDC domain-containing protein, partial [Thermoanaerobaculia bacterium]